jgi:hypothetical protein
VKKDWKSFFSDDKYAFVGGLLAAYAVGFFSGMTYQRNSNGPK